MNGKVSKAIYKEAEKRTPGMSKRATKSYARLFKKEYKRRKRGY